MHRTIKHLIAAAAVAAFAALASVSAFSQGAGPRYALVIGNGDYTSFGKLSNPVNDAADVAAALKGLGFQVDLLKNASRKQMNRGINDFHDKLAQDPSSEGFFWYAGHGVQAGGENYLVPVSADIAREADLEDETVGVRKLVSLLDDARNRVNVIVLDACRNNPVPGLGRSASRGLSVVSAAPPESVIMYSTGAGQVAADGTGRNSPFAQAFLKYVAQGGDITATIKAVTSETKRLTNGSQVPYLYSSLTVDFALNRKAALAPQGRAAAPASSEPDFGEVQIARGGLDVSLSSTGTVSLAGKQAEVPAGGCLPIRNLAPGSYEVCVSYPDGKAEKKSVEVRPDQNASLSFGYVPASADFGAAGVHYVMGDLHLFRQSDGDFELWQTSSDFALEIVQNSNGWWYMRSEGKEFTVYPLGTIEPTSFFNRPWTNAPSPQIVSGSLSFDARGTYGATRFQLDGSTVTITLSDRGVLTIPTNEPRITFVNYDGKSFTFPSGATAVASSSGRTSGAASAAGTPVVPTDFISLCGFSSANKIDDVLRKLGKATKLTDDKGMSFKSYYWRPDTGAWLTISSDKSTNKVIAVLLNADPEKSESFKAYLRRLGIVDGKIDLLGKPREEVLRGMGVPKEKEADGSSYDYELELDGVTRYIDFQFADNPGNTCVGVGYRCFN